MPTSEVSQLDNPRPGEALHFLPDWSLNGIILYLTATLFFYLPLSMPFRYLMHRFLDPNKGWTFLVYPETWTIVLLLILAGRMVGRRGFGRTLRQDKTFALLLACAAGYATVATLSAIVQGSDPRFFVRKVAMEWVLPALLGLTLRVLWSNRLDREIWRSLTLGGFIILGVGIVTYFASFGIPTTFVHHVYSNRTFLIWKGMAGGVSFGEIPMGGVNVLAGGVATLLCLVLGGLVLAKTTRRGVYLLAWVLAAAIVEFLCFSRGTLLFVFALPAGLLLVSREFRRSRWFHGAGVVVALLLLASILPAGAYRYWRSQLTLEEGSSAASRLRQAKSALAVERIRGQEIPEFALDKINQSQETPNQAGHENIAKAGPVASTQETGPQTLPTQTKKRKKPKAEKRVAARLQKLKEAAEGGEGKVAPRPSLEALRQRIGSPRRRLLIGYGPGHYGLLRGLVADSGTHNIFLNALVDCGVGGLFFFTAFFAIGFWRRFRGWRLADGEVERVLQLSKLAAFVSIVCIGVLVDYRLENLGTMTGAGVLWYLLASPSTTATATQASALGRGSGLDSA